MCNRRPTSLLFSYLTYIPRYFDPDTDPPHARSDPKAQGPHDARATRTLPDDNGPLGHRDAVDSTLTAFCQLVAIRLGVQRAGVSLVDRDRQYVLAESTPSLDLGLDPFSPTLTTQSWSGWSDVCATQDYNYDSPPLTSVTAQSTRQCMREHYPLAPCATRPLSMFHRPRFVRRRALQRSAVRDCRAPD